MKITYLSNSTIFSKTANNIQVFRMCDNLSPLVKSLNLYVYKNKKSDIDNLKTYYDTENNFNIQFYTFAKTILKYLNPFIVVFKNILNKKNHIFYCRNKIAALILTNFNFKVIYEAHNIIKQSNYFFESKIIKSKNTIAIVFISNELKKWYQSRFKSEKFHVLHDGAEIKKNEKINNPFNLNKINITYIGSLYHGRGIELIIELAEHFKKYNFNIVGGDKEQILLLKNISPKNIIYHGYKNQSQLVNYRNFSDILLMPYKFGLSNPGSYEDTSRWMSPMKMFEYMSSGVPIISSDIKVLREVLNEKNSVLVDYKLNEWIDGINLILKNKSFSRKISQKALRDLKSKYTWKNRAQKIIKLIENTK